jgi:hypothetical protein
MPSSGKARVLGHDHGAALPDALPQISDELLVGVAYFTIRLLMLRHFERDGRRAGSFERF